MKYEHLMNKIENAHCYVNRITMIALENTKDSEKVSEIMEDFFNNELKYICKVLDFKTDKDTLEYIENEIEDNSFVYTMMSKGDKGGFLAEVYTPECNSFSFDGEGNPQSWQVVGNICNVEWVYADTLDELSDKIVEVGNKNFKEFVEKEK